MNILYICTHNRCRSVLSEAITRQNTGDTVIVKSAGSQPAGKVHPLTLKYLEQAGYNIDGLSSKSWDIFESSEQDFKPDVVVTVCDNAKGEACPLWLGDTPKIHWGLPDPSKLAEDELTENGESSSQVEQAFNQVIATIESRVEALVKIADLSKDEQIKALQKLVI